MKKGLIVFLLISLLIGGCSGATEAPAHPASAKPSDTASPAAPSLTEESPSPAATSAPASGSRKAILSEVQKSVFFRAAPNSQPQPASVGMEILPQGGIDTGEDGRARLDLQPEGTIVRVGPNSSFTLTELSESEGKPKTLLELFFGKAYILLNGGSLKVQTPGGAAAVQGSVMSVTYHPDTKAVKVVCLEGHCVVEDKEGNQVELKGGEMSFIFEDEGLTDPMTIDNREIWDWLNEIPEMPDFFEELPNPEDFPDPYFDWQYEMPTFEPGATFDPNMAPGPAITDDPNSGQPPDGSGAVEPPPEGPGGTEPPP